MRQFLSFLILLSLCLSVHAQRPPAREFRGAWIATVKNVDWPSRSGLSTEEQQQELTEMLDQFQSCGINAVIFQVRPAGDAFYESSYEPWSEWLTGRQGQPPFPRYDPLEWLINACHARGMELHAWFNPFRALTDPGSARQLDPRHLAMRQPELLLRYGSNLYLDPGLPEAREYA
ncbi:MAG: glycoside hydrolase, partial [Bacteroidetes bacterium]